MDMSKKKRLNVDKVEAQLTNLGLSQSQVAAQLDVSRQAVSKWLKGEKFPRPAKLLKLAQLLKLSFNDIVIKLDISAEPVVAFRKKGSHRISQEYIEDAKDKGYLLEKIVPYLPYDELSSPPALINPQLKYEYIQKAASRVRKEIDKIGSYKIDFEDLIDFFNQYHAVIIPVLWGNKKNHENALHVFLPQSMTTWIYLNLDSKIHDFKFWMAHELGHIKTPNLKDDQAEEFADSFAGALLVSQDLAESEYIHLRRLSDKSYQINRIKELAEDLTISPLTIYYEINKYAEYSKKPIINLEQNREIYKANTNFCNQYKSLSKALFKELPPSPKSYLRSAKELFNSPFFESLHSFLVEKKKSVGFLQALLSLPPADAHLLYQEIC